MKKVLATLMVVMLVFGLFTPLTVRAANTDTVYVTKTGTKYHNYGCQHLRSSQIPVTLEYAVGRGYAPCIDCHSDRLVYTPAAPATAGITPEQAVQQAFALYVQNGFDQNTALQRVQAKTAEIVSQPANIAAIVAADIAAIRGQGAAAPTAPATATMTPQQAVQQAFALYIQNGFDQNTALQRVQAKTAEIVANPANIPAIVQADIAALKGAAPAGGKLTPEQIVQQAFAQCIAAGMTQEQALATVQANLPALLAQAQ